jgi:geranylgeranyl diphosphate synthase type I
MGVEITHAAILIHDDFMDQDEMRRGGPTTQKYFRDKTGADMHFCESMAVMEGDALLCIGFELVADACNLEATKQMLRTVTHTVYGQVYDIELGRLKTWQEEDVIKLHMAKTGFYTYRNPLFIGAILAGIKDPKIFDLLDSYAMDGGVAFQLQDDILGVYGTPEKTGKSADSDLKQGKCTLMVLKAYEMGNAQQQAAVRKVWGNNEATREELDAAKKAIFDCGAYEYNKKVAQDYARKASETANKLRQFNLNEEAIDYIQGIAEYMVQREV